MAGRFGLVSLAVVAALALSVTGACAANRDRTIEKPSTTGTVTEGTESARRRWSGGAGRKRYDLAIQ